MRLNELFKQVLVDTRMLISFLRLTVWPRPHALPKRGYGFVPLSSLPPVELRMDDPRGEGVHSLSPYLQ